MVFPSAKELTPQATPQVEQLLKILTSEHSRQDLQETLKLSDREYFRKSFLQPAINDGLVELTIPSKPKSSKQRYRLTEKGKNLLRSIENR